MITFDEIYKFIYNHLNSQSFGFTPNINIRIQLTFSTYVNALNEVDAAHLK